jgi:4-methylaminobutanoate oxidase (formaldehyde-forming)
VPVGKLVYTQMLNDRGGIESDLTVTRLSETSFLLVVPAATMQRDLHWLNKYRGDASLTVMDLTAAEAVICVMGPKTRDVLAGCSPDDFTNATHPFGMAKEIEIGMGLARAHRVSYVGELGFEIYVSADQAAHVFEAITEAGAPHGLKLCGLHAMDSCRIEKAFRHFGHDITDEDHVLEAGLGFAVAKNKTGFNGYDAVMRKREAGLDNRMVQFRMKDPEVMLYHNEPVLRDGKIVSYLTSGNYGHALGASIGMGYVPCKGQSVADMLSSTYSIEVAGQHFEAEASTRPMYDPTSAAVKL